MTKANWIEQSGVLAKEFLFADFTSSVEFCADIAIAADQLNHHPTLTVSWGKVVVSTTTHDAGNTVTELDHQLAEKIDRAYTLAEHRKQIA